MKACCIMFMCALKRSFCYVPLPLDAVTARMLAVNVLGCHAHQLAQATAVPAAG